MHHLVLLSIDVALIAVATLLAIVLCSPQAYIFAFVSAGPLSPLHNRRSRPERRAFTDAERVSKVGNGRKSRGSPSLY